MRNWTTKEQILPLSIATFEISPSLLNAQNFARFGCSVPKQKEYFRQERTGIRKPKRNFKIQIISKQFSGRHTSIQNSTMIIMLVIIYIMYGQSKLKALVTNIAMQQIKGVESTDMSDMLCTCKTQ